MTKLTKPVSRETAEIKQGRAIVITIQPAGSTALLWFRAKGTRTAYKLGLEKAYLQAALEYAEREKAAKKLARKNGIPWKQAKRDFAAKNSI